MAILDTTVVPKVQGGTISGPASYPTGGFLVDLTAQYSFLRFLKLSVAIQGSLPARQLVYTLNRNLSGAFAPGMAVVKIMKEVYDRGTVGAVSGNPGGTTVEAALAAAATTTGSSHTHTMNHDHAAVVSDANNTGGGAVTGAGGGPALSAHTHSVDVENFTGSTAAATHTHNRAFEYEHNHATTQIDTAVVLTELANATNLSTTSFIYVSVGD